MDCSSFAYSLSQGESGWSWRVLDEQGEIVARGSAPERALAEQFISELFRAAPEPQA